MFFSCHLQSLMLRRKDNMTNIMLMFICMCSFFLFQPSVMSDPSPLNYFLCRRHQQNSVKTVKLKWQQTRNTLGKRLAEGINPQLCFILPQTQENRHPGNFYSLKHLRMKAGSTWVWRTGKPRTTGRKSFNACRCLMTREKIGSPAPHNFQFGFKFSSETRKWKQSVVSAQRRELKSRFGSDSGLHLTLNLCHYCGFLVGFIRALFYREGLFKCTIQS